ncbi:MAG: hypothetical protein ACLFWZ_11495 [Coleofasciculus sp.]
MKKSVKIIVFKRRGAQRFTQRDAEGVIGLVLAFLWALEIIGNDIM